MDEASRSLWERVCATVNRWGQPRSPRIAPPVEMAPDNCLDLHGYRVHDAFYATKEFIEQAEAGATLTVITGKSGRINTEFTDWLWQFKRVRTFETISDGGAFRIRLKN